MARPWACRCPPNARRGAFLALPACGAARLRLEKPLARPSDFRPRGEVAEWSNVPHSKCGVPERVPWVRIPPSPPPIFSLYINNLTASRSTPERRHSRRSNWCDRAVLRACSAANGAERPVGVSAGRGSGGVSLLTGKITGNSSDRNRRDPGPGHAQSPARPDFQLNHDALTPAASREFFHTDQGNLSPGGRRRIGASDAQQPALIVPAERDRRAAQILQAKP